MHELPLRTAPATAQTSAYGEREHDDVVQDVLEKQFGFPVKENAPKIRIRPHLTFALIFLLALGWHLTRTDPKLVSALTLDGTNPWRLGGLNVISYVFVNPAGFALFQNLYFIWIFGTSIEQLVGAWGLLAVAAAGVAGGGIAHGLLVSQGPGAQLVHFTLMEEFFGGWTFSLMGPLTGASPLAAALMLFFALTFPHARIGFEVDLVLHSERFRMSTFGWFSLWLLGLAITELRGISSDTPIMLGGVVGGAAAGLMLGLLGGIVSHEKHADEDRHPGDPAR
jgi:membrane associated rhomboid family serine protease